MNAVLHDWRMDLCGLHPGTKYLVRVRAQDKRAEKHWSSWSGSAEATTAEAGEEQIEGDTEIKLGVLCARAQMVIKCVFVCISQPQWPPQSYGDTSSQ